MYQYINVYSVAILASIIFFLYNRMSRDSNNRNDLTDSAVVGVLVVVAVKALEYAVGKKVERLTTMALQ